MNRALDNFREGAAIERAAKFRELEVFETSLQEMTAERDRLIAGEHEPPPSPYTRDAKSRDDRTGAPLWQLCEFVDGVPDNHRAAVEAALEASGILDAWINPDGGVTSFEAFDSFLRNQGAAIAGSTLLEVLRPSLEHVDGMAPHVPHGIVQNILGRIGLNEGPALTWIDVKGRWQLGVLSGRWEKPAAQHIGNAAREAERIRRIRELDAMLDDVRQSILATRLMMKAIDDRSLLADTEANRAPSEHGVGIVIAQRDTQRKQLDQARLRLEELEKALAVAKDDLDRKIEHRDTSAADLGLSNWTERLQALDDALGEYRQSLVILWSAARDEVSAVRTLAESTLRLNRDRDRSERLGQASHDAAQKAAAAAASHYQALHETVGAAVEEVQRQLQDARTLLDRIHTDQKQNDKKVGTTEERIKSLAASVDLLTDEIEEDIARRAAAIDRLLRFTKTALIDITAGSLAGVGRGEMAVTPAVDLAREIASALADVNFDDDAWNGTQKAIHNHIQNLTNSLQRHDYRPEQTLEDDTLVVTAPLHGVHRPMKEFSAILADEIIQRRSLLTAKELELLENYLIQDVAVEMGKLIRDAEDLVAGMNRQLHSRPNSTGMTLRFNWQPDADGPVAFADARKKLLGDHATWSPADRTALGHFLQEQITRARDAEASRTWQEQLATALDYRRCHEFHVERRQDNKWVRLNRKTHGTGSGGEKAIALTIPQFAAACAYYDSASPTAPRLILLDEAFVGIDADMRGKCMGLLHEFDLDFVMTSEREWGCYRSMPGLAIYQLSAHAGIDAVLASRWVWNGRERVQQNPVSAYGNGRPPARTDLPGLDATSTPL